MKVKIKAPKRHNVIDRAYHEFIEDLDNNRYKNYYIKGGRGSGKTTTVCIQTIYNMLYNKEFNVVVCMRYQEHLRKTIYNTFCWVIEYLNLESLFKYSLSPLEITYIPSKTKIIFSGLDDPRKLKGIKFITGSCKRVIFEECDMIETEEVTRNVIQTLSRNTDNFSAIYIFNPPSSRHHYLNKKTRDKLTNIYHYNYLDIDKKHLKEDFFAFADHLKETDNDRYRHEYLGELIDTELQVFHNIKEWNDGK